MVAVAVVACVFVVISRSGSSSVARKAALREAALIAAALVALVVQAAVWPTSTKNKTPSRPAKESFVSAANPAVPAPSSAAPKPAVTVPAVAAPAVAVPAVTAPAVAMTKPAVPAAVALPAAAAAATAAAVSKPAAPAASVGPEVPSSDVTPENLGQLPSGTTTYVTALNPLSYGSPQTSGRTWRNVASTPTAGATGDHDFHFRTTPSVSRPGGFVLGANTIAGPQSHMLGLDGDAAITAFMVFQPTGPAPTCLAPMFQIFANTTGGNGLTLSTNDKEVLHLVVGSSMAMPCKVYQFNAAHRYLVAATKDRTAYRVSLVDLDAGSFELNTLLQGSKEHPERVPLANVDMAINSDGKWNASLIAFGLVSRALGDGDLAALHGHFVATLREYNPEYRRLRVLTEAATKARSCPFDATTCGACGRVADWSASSGALFASGGASCLKSIHEYCVAHPSESRCSCWNTSNPEYAGSCAPYRTLFADAGKPAKAAVPPPPPSAPKTPAPPAGELSPASIDAITRLIKAASATAAPSSCGRCGGVVRSGERHECPHQEHHRSCDRCGSAIKPGEKHECRKNGRRDGHDDDDDGKPGFWSWLFGGGWLTAEST